MKFVIKWTVVAQEVEGNMWNSNPHVKVSFSKILKLYLIQSSECVCVRVCWYGWSLFHLSLPQYLCLFLIIFCIIII